MCIRALKQARVDYGAHLPSLSFKGFTYLVEDPVLLQEARYSQKRVRLFPFSGKIWSTWGIQPEKINAGTIHAFTHIDCLRSILSETKSVTTNFLIIQPVYNLKNPPQLVRPDE